MSDYEVVIGLEVHVQLKTNSKLFCGCPTEFGLPPNTNICPVCTGQPGVLPVINKKAIEFTILTGFATGCKIAKKSVFARKNYFYPDLPKNYQISQYELPLCENGFINIIIDGKEKKIGITRIHLEEDAGKLLHAIGSRELDYSLVDFNRTGIPLMEIVSEPDMNSPEEAYRYLLALKSALQYIGVSDCDMEKGFLRCDANISIRPVGEKRLGTKAELKNMNSFKAIKDALAYEIGRQVDILKNGKKIIQETRLWNEEKDITEPMRSKEEAHDYRYFPEPDLVPIEIDERFISEIKGQLVELPEVRKKRFIEKFGLSEYDAGVLISEKSLADYFENCLNHFSQVKTCDYTTSSPQANLLGHFRLIAKQLANWLTTELLGKLNAENKDITDSPISPQQLAELVKLIADGTISGKIAKTVFEEMFKTGKNPDEIVKEHGLVQMSDEKEIEKLVDEAISENQKAVAEYKSGKHQALGSLVGAVMKKSKGLANPKLVNEILKKKLS